MAILKSRPSVRVRVPNEIRPGDDFRAVVVLDCKRPVEIRFVEVVLEGKEHWSIGAGDSSVSRSQVLLRLGAPLSDERTLPKGRTELSVRIPLPEHSPPSFRGSASEIEYSLAVHVSIPWWPDRRSSFEIHVAPTEVASPDIEPQIYSSDPKGPVAREPHVEVSLAGAWTRVGDIVIGALALNNVAHNRYSEIQVGLRGVETLYDAGRERAEREYMRYQIRLGAEQAREGEMIPFRFRLPDDAMADLPQVVRPEGRAPLFSLRWQLEVVVGIHWGSDLTLRMPFRVLPRSKRPGDAPSRLAPPPVGSDRLRGVWEACGEAHGLRYEAQTLYGQLGGTTLSIRRDHLGRDGIFVVAEISYPELHLDLEVEPATKIQKMVGGGVRVGHPSWDRDHYVRARDADQVALVLRALLPAMASSRLRRMDDRRLTIGVRDAGTSRTRMERFVAASSALARTFEAIRRDLPPPPSVASSVGVWRELAARTGAELETARMRIKGQLGTMEAEVRLAFDDDGRPLSTWISVRPPSPIDTEHELHVTGDTDDVRTQLERRFDGEVLEIVKVIADGAHELEIEPMRVSVCLPTLLGVGPEDPASKKANALSVITIGAEQKRTLLTSAIAEQKLSRLGRLITLLRGQAGPYR